MALSPLPLLLFGFDEAWQRLDHRLDGLTQDEYLWSPVESAWTIHDIDGAWIADWADPDPDPTPFTTIAWRLWHVASGALAGYLDRSPDGNPLQLGRLEWHADVASAVRDLGIAVSAFRRRMIELGEDGLAQPLGPAWGQYAESSWAELFVHATDELAHHGAEIALLRDLYRWRS
jgi:hypothetical protein